MFLCSPCLDATPIILEAVLSEMIAAKIFEGTRKQSSSIKKQLLMCVALFNYLHNGQIGKKNHKGYYVMHAYGAIY